MPFKKEFLTLPNFLSFYRLILSLLLPLLFYLKTPPKWIYFLIFTGALSDTLDGNLARLLKQKSALGKILDPLADKCFINTLFFLLYLDDKIDIYFFLIILFRDVFIMLGSFYLYKNKYPLTQLSPTILGKSSTVFQLITLIIFYINFYLYTLPNFLVKTFTIFTLFFTTTSGFHYFLIFKKLFLQTKILR